jgi:hypothetical protein
MSLQHAHNTRLTPEKPARGGRRDGAGRPQKENHNPNWPEQLSAARQHQADGVKQNADYQHQQNELTNSRGRSWSYDECTLILTLLIGIILRYGETPTQALHTVSALLHRSYNSLHALWHMWQTEREVYQVDTTNRGGGATTHVHHSHQVGVEAAFAIIEYIRQANADGGGCTSTDLLDHLFTQHSLSMHKSTLCHVLASMGFRYGKSNVIGKMNDAWYVARIRAFLIQYSAALQAEARGECVLVYTDESFVNVNHSRKSTWYSPLAPEGNDVVRPSGKGKRLVLLHAFTKHGWLTDDSSVHNDRADQWAASCELVYEAEKADGDYHDNMNGTIYMQWLTNRLLPTFAHRFPGKKMVLMLDNASYHHHRGPEWISVSSMTKQPMADKMVELGISCVVVERQKKGTEEHESKTFQQHSFHSRGGPHAPTLVELRQSLTAHLAAHPELNRTEVFKLLTHHRHELLYTPPYLPGVQPIERLWAYSKNYVASRYKTGRTMRDLLTQTYQAFYGDGDKHAGVDAGMALSVIRHSWAFCDYLIEQDDSLDGTIHELITQSSVVVPDVEHDIEADMAPFAGAEDAVGTWE